MENNTTTFGFAWRRNIGAQIMISILLLIFSIISTSLAANPMQQKGFSKELFPVPEVIKPNVEFWKKVYAVYPSNYVLIHDSEDLSIIYTVVSFDSLFPDPSAVSESTKWKKIESIKKEYRALLNEVAEKYSAPEMLAEKAKRIRQLFKGEVNVARLRRAAGNIRGQQGLREKFHLGLQRSGLYRVQLDEVFRENNLPRELIMLPHVESSFNYKAYSKVGAAGIWQFTRGTGRLYMKVSYDVDERLDPIIATEAAAKLLKNNFDELGYWPLAITAYNHGLNGMKRAQGRFGNDFGKIYSEYSSRSFGFASRNFYAEFLAALEVASEYENYFGSVEFYSPRKFQTFVTDKYYSVESILENFNLVLDEFKDFNPALRPPVASGQRRIPRGYILRVPDKDGVDEKALWASFSPSERFSEQVPTQWYKVRRGDNLSAIARRVNVPLQKLVEYNNLVAEQGIFPGQVLKIPAPGEQISTETSPPVLVADASLVPKSAENVAAAIAAPTKPSVEEKATVSAEVTRTFEFSTGLATPDAEIPPPNTRVEFAAGEDNNIILVPSEEPIMPIAEEQPMLRTFEPEPVSEWIRVEPEETIGHYAEWLEVPTQRLRDLNKMTFSQELRIGQRIRLKYNKVGPEEFQRRRYEYLRGIEEDFFAVYSVDGTKTHTIHRGETIWYLTNRLYGLPLWLIAKYNPGRDLEDLHIGDEVAIPIVAIISTDQAVPQDQ